MELKGIHHVSSITAVAKNNYDFYTNFLGMRLVKKSVNQDDTSMYHLFYADEVGRPGTDLTFFEIIRAGHTYEGNNSISLTSLRVANDEALTYWKKRFEKYEVEHGEIEEQFGRNVLFFKDPEGQRLMLVSDEKNKGVAAGTPWAKSPVPQDKGITGLGPVKLTVPEPEPTVKVLTDIMGFTYVGSYPAYVEGQPDVQVFETGEGGTGAEVHLEHRTDLPKERPGRGSVHHVAFRVDNEEELAAWRDKIRAARMPNSGLVDRYYFKSLYFRERNGILFELATDGPGFATDEDVEHLGETVALPPFLEDKREAIEAKLMPLDTTK
ncbi:ring-cleaving dioxygenase [Aquibacillus koreensis]|uniref:Ring-cleaving dioxygenase n=1 Tax=Aquibacillus koreensis TaxID=279446 RepID=A0A9X3WMG2_9BACI|nr:ring-cleaving dioxygenase [Aquibacillus koreensis]MCT2538165.1 ring-cleaving dioxygenase [Aquibacillus koreensis]MDC3420891.1 ring-cleaving dioxygenase [Aquibacillus koreensis]